MIRITRIVPLSKYDSMVPFDLEYGSRFYFPLNTMSSFEIKTYSSLKRSADKENKYMITKRSTMHIHKHLLDLISKRNTYKMSWMHVDMEQ